MSSNPSGKIIVFTAPSGAGKSTIVRYLLENNDNLDFSISATTRKPRKDEVDGKSYYFLSNKEFQDKIRNDEFIEYEEVYEDVFYGSLKSEIDRIWNNGQTAIFDIDVEGAVEIKKLYQDQVLTIFVKAPSFEILKERLRNRNTESEESYQKRVQKATREMKYEPYFDVTLYNDQLAVTLQEAEEIVSEFLNK